jgi:hypothetical protein
LELAAMPRGTIQVQSGPATYTGRADAGRGSRPLPLGFSLLIAAGISVGLWAGLIQLGMRLLG